MFRPLTGSSSGLLYKPGDDPVSGRNTVAKAKYIYIGKELC
jgi:hypothetical protein